MQKTIMMAFFFAGSFPFCFAEPTANAPKQPVRVVSSGDMLNWTVGLLLVLAIFFFCVWAVRKLNINPLGGAEKMRVIGGLSLGLREKVILLQVGKKQLILGVSPGRINTLHVLEGEDCLSQGDSLSKAGYPDNSFAHQLLQVMKGRADG